MSAYICSDKHIATIAVTYGNLTGMPKDEVQKLADQLKRWNTRSVNHRYNERTRMAPCSLAEVAQLGSTDMVALCECLEYQSCERQDWKTDCGKAYERLTAIKAQFKALVACSPVPLRESTVWSI